MTTSIQKDAALSSLATLAYKDEAYLRNAANIPTGWVYQKTEVNGPFAAAIFKNSTTGEVAVAFRGTDGVKDGGAGLSILAGTWNAQFQNGMDLINKISGDRDYFPKGFNRANLLVTGHSLGGAIAQVVSQAYGLDGSTIDPGAASRIVNTAEFKAAAMAAGLPPGGLGIVSSFTNHVAINSIVSGGTGAHLGKTSLLPSVEFSSAQGAMAFLLGAINPIAGFAYVVGADQFGNKHSSAQLSQALGLMAGLDTGATSGGMVLSPVVLRWELDRQTRQEKPVYSQTEFVLKDANGNAVNKFKFSGSGTDRELEVLDSNGDRQSIVTQSATGVVTVNAIRGGSIRINTGVSQSVNSDGCVTTTYSDAQGTVFKTETLSESTLSTGQTVTVTETVNHLAKGTDIASSKTLATAGGAKIINSTTAEGHIQEETYATVNGKQALQSSKTLSYSQAERDTAALDVSLAGLEFMQALRSGNKLQAAGSLIRLVNNAEIASNKMPTLGAIGTGFAGAVSLISALDSWGNASDGERIALTARAVLGANDIARSLSVDGKTGFLESGPALGALQGIVALASLDATLKSGNPFAIASSFMTLTNAAITTGMVSSSTVAGAFGTTAFSQTAMFGPQAMICMAIASMLFSSLFASETKYPSPPPAGQGEVGVLSDGSLGMLIKDTQGKAYQTRKLTGEVFSNTGKATDGQNWGMGADLLGGRMGSLIADLKVQATKDGTHLILERLPSLSVHAYPSFDRNGVDNFFFGIHFKDPGTGAQQMAAVANSDVGRQFKEIAAYAGVAVGATEWAQIQAKRAAGDVYATETEGQFVDRLSGPSQAERLVLKQLAEKNKQAYIDTYGVLTKAQADAQEASNRQSYSLLTLDLEGNGIVRKTQQTAGMKLEDLQADTTKGVSRFDVDNDGFMELTEWVGSKEAILGLDRNGDGVLNTAEELFSGGELSDAAENLGLKRLAFFDANKDGKLDALDPYFKSFKLWLDINGDARTGVGELYGLAETGVKSIHVGTGAVSFTDGQTIALQKTQLNADVRGVAVSGVSDGKGGVRAGQYMVHQEGKDAELNLTADASSDLSGILKLFKPNSNLSDTEKAELKALATKYGVDLSNPAALLGLGGGGNMAGGPSSTTAAAGDVFTISKAPNAEEIKQALRAFFTNINHDPDAGPNLANHVLAGQEDTQFKIKTADLLAGLTGVKLVSVQEARRGAVRLDANGDVVFDPLANQNGTGYFTYTAKDSQGRLSTAMVWLTIASVNDTPVALADTFSVKEDNILTLAVSQLLANDTDADIATDANEKLSITAVGKANHGTVKLVNGQVVFKADADYQGLASFEYSVSDVAGATATATASVTVVGENDAPVLAGSVNKILAKPDTLLRIEAATLLAYVKDADLAYGDSLRLKQILSVSAGNAWQQKDGSVLFKAGTLGDALLKFEVTDSQGSTLVVPITINVAASNAAAKAVLPGLDQATEDTAVRIGSTQVIASVVSATNGAAFIDQDGSMVFTPRQNYNGLAQVVYAVRNADGSTSQKTVDFTIIAVNDAPVVVRALDVQAMDEDGRLTVSQASLLATVDDVDIATNGQKLRVTKVSDGVNGAVALDANGNVVFTPNKDFNGAARFTYWVSDDAGITVAAQASVTVRAVNDAPTPFALRFDLMEDERRTFSNASLIANAELVDIDTKTNGDVLRVTAVSMDAANAGKGTVSVDTAGNVSFIPRANYYGAVSFSYTVTDSAGAKGQNTVTLNIAAVNDAPVANNSSMSLSAGVEDNVKVISFAELVRNFTDVDGDALTVKSVTAAYGGSVTIAGGQVLFTPVKDFNGMGSFSYTVADPYGATASSSATVAFANTNDAPVAAYKWIDGRAYEDTPLYISFSELTSGAYDVDGDAVSLQSVRGLSNGSAWIDWNSRQVVFLGGSNVNGWSGFDYTLSDPSGATSTQRVDVKVIAVNDNPTVRAVTGYSIWEDGYWANNSQDSNYSAPVRLTNFLSSIGAADVDGNTLSFNEFWSANHINSIWRDGNDLMLSLENNYNGAAGFAYRVRDNQGGWADGQVHLTVAPQNDRPSLVGLPGWYAGNARTNPLGGNINSQIYGVDIDSPLENLSACIGYQPVHGDASLNRTTYEEWRGKLLSTGTLPATWDLTYANRYGDEASRNVSFAVDVWDEQGGWARQYVETYHQGTRASRGGKPVAIDLNGDGIKYTNLDDSKVLFDISSVPTFSHQGFVS